LKFEFATAGRVVFGAGCSRELGPLSREFGRRIAVLTGRSPDRHPGPWQSLADAGAIVIRLPWTGAHSEPDVEMVVTLARLLCTERAECVVGLGGGGVLDAAKAIAALATNPGDPLNYLEVVGRGAPLQVPPLPVIALPTTAGTGAEVTRNAVLNVPTHQAKVSLRHPLMLPRLALVDPELTHAVPRELSATTGMDALTQCLEPMVSARANPFVDALAAAGLQRAARSLRCVCADGSDAPAREDLAFASVCGGMALANAGLGAVHGLAGPLGGLYPGTAHGALCAALLGPVMAANLRALRLRSPAHPAIAAYQRVAALLTGHPAASADEGVAWIHALAHDLGIPNLKALGLPGAERPVMVQKSQQASSMKANPIPLTDAELNQVLLDAGLPNCG